jgi:DNA helicase IV
LFYNGVEYTYERPYEHSTVTATHSQYEPDFYYPAMQLYHEHFAINRQGKAPPQFENYLAGVAWKRGCHAQHGTDFIETTSAQFYDGSAFKHLETQFKIRGVRLNPNPDRPTRGRTPVEHRELVNVFRSFICHAKSNCRSDADLRKQIKGEGLDAFRFRHSMFLDLLEPVRAGWESALKAAGAIDFEDMLNFAAEHLESGRWESPYDLVMVDEFQDASWARARMSLALVKKPGRHLFAVGDDWQSINRFAGADISVMTGFRDWCGHGQVLKLERTFRCPQALCDATSAFVMQNEKQIRKSVRSRTPAYGPVLNAFQVPDRTRLQGAIDRFIENLHTEIARGDTPAGNNGKVSVFILGRYRVDEQYVPFGWRERYGDRLDVAFRTVHASKGSEADYIVLPQLVKRGFPSWKQDDPVLTLAMPAEDLYPKAEERRLFYVALTRARRSVAMFTIQGQVSEFLLELMTDHQVSLLDADGAPTHATVCPKCEKGVMVERQRRNDGGTFLSCNNFPPCRHSMNPPGRVKH